MGFQQDLFPGLCWAVLSEEASEQQLGTLFLGMRLSLPAHGQEWAKRCQAWMDLNYCLLCLASEL